MHFARSAAPAAATLLLALVLPLALAGCGGGDKDAAPAAEPARGSLVPAAADTAPADSTLAATTSSEPPAGAGLGEGEFAPAREPDTPDTAAELKPAGGVDKAAAGPTGAARQSGRDGVAATDTGGAYSLQLGSFAKASNARAQRDRVAALGYAPVLEVATLGGQTYHRVVLPGLSDRAAAERLGERIRSELGITYLIRQQ